MIEQYNQQFLIEGHIHFEVGQGGLAKAVIRNSVAQAEVYLQGAHVTSFQPIGSEPVLWLSEDSLFQAGKAIRGGIPVIWPWFGPHPTEETKPQHGFARIMSWSIREARALSQGETLLRLGLSSSTETRAIWPQDFDLTLDITVGVALTVALTAHNQGRESIEVSGALHTYFRVDDVGYIQVEGLESRSYLDKVTGYNRKHQVGPILIDQEVDRIYLETEDECQIVDPLMKRQIHIDKAGSCSTVVWNPWQERAQQMSDFPDDGYKTMVCVETANAAEDVRQIEPGEGHTLMQKISV
ncbi:MAG: D-hexose-6-phosphate mutarotase [Chloroflexota bacterium]